MVSNPLQLTDGIGGLKRKSEVSPSLVSLLDIVPTIMDWHKVPLPSYSILKKSVVFKGTSLLSSPSAEAPAEEGGSSTLPSNF